MYNEESKAKDLLLNLVIKIILPCTPIIYERFANSIGNLNLDFPNRDILCVGIILPIVWLIESRERLVIYFASLVLGLSTITFMLSMFNSEESRIFLAGSILMGVAAFIIAVIEIWSYRKKKYAQPTIEKKGAQI